MKYFKEIKRSEPSKSRGEFRTQASIYDRVFLWIYLTAYYFRLFFAYYFRSSWLLKLVAFLVVIAGQPLLEPIDVCVTHLWTLTKSYKYRIFEDKMIRDYIVVICVLSRLRRRSLLLENDLSLELLHAIAWKKELSGKQVTKMENRNPTENSISMLKNLTKGVLSVNSIKTLNILGMVKQYIL